MARPYVTVDLGKIEHNARTVVRTCAAAGIEVAGVTKATAGLPEVAGAMLRGGVTAIGESRLANIRRLRAAGVETSYLLLRVPPLSEVDAVIDCVDVSLNSELVVLEGLSQAAARRGELHDVVVMVDLGDLREGVMPDDVVPFAGEVLKLPGVRLIGLGANLTCFGGVIPTPENMGRLVECVSLVERAFGIELRFVSGGNSSALPLISLGEMPQRINHARMGESILLGRETVHRTPWPDTSQDAFLLHAEVVEVKRKPSVPIGERAEDAFGHEPSFEDRGDVDRALVNVGRADVEVEGTDCVDPRFTVLGASSDYLIVDVTAGADELRVGDELVFTLDYAALLAVMTSEYVEPRFVGAPE